MFINLQPVFFFFFFNIFVLCSFFGQKKGKKSPLHSPPLKSEYQISTRAAKCMHAHAVCFCLLPPLLLRMQTESVEHSPDHVLSACFQACHYVVCYWRYLKRLFDSQKYSNAISFTMWLCDTWPHPQSHKKLSGKWEWERHFARKCRNIHDFPSWRGNSTKCSKLWIMPTSPNLNLNCQCTEQRIITKWASYLTP